MLLIVRIPQNDDAARIPRDQPLACDVERHVFDKPAVPLRSQKQAAEVEL